MRHNFRFHALSSLFAVFFAVPSLSGTFIEAKPYHWPFNGDLRPENTALIIIDMQRDFLDDNGYVGRMGYDVSVLRKAIAPITNLLLTARKVPGLTIIHTREGHRADLSDCPKNKQFRSKNIGAEIGSQGPLGRILVRGEPGWEIIDELKPLDTEIIIDKPGKGSFYATDLDMILRKREITNLIIMGVTTDVCVQTTLRDANDRGYECLVLEDCTAATKPENHQAIFPMIDMQGGVCGTHSTSDKAIKDFLTKFLPREKTVQY